MKETHTHHSLPRHVIEWNDPINLIECTIEEHAEHHRYLWEVFNYYEDYVAWRMLSGQMEMSEASREMIEVGQSRGGKIGGKRAKSAEEKAKISAGHRKLVEAGTHPLQQEEARNRTSKRNKQLVAEGKSPFQIYPGGRARKPKSQHMKDRLSKTLKGHPGYYKGVAGGHKPKGPESEETKRKKKAYHSTPEGREQSRLAGIKGAQARWRNHVRQKV